METEKSIIEPYEGYKETQLESLGIQKKKVRNSIFYIALILLAGALLALLVANRFNILLLIDAIFFPAIFLGIGFFAMKQPMVSVIIAAIVFVLLLILQILISGGIGAISGLILKAIVIYFILSAYQSAKEFQKIKREIELF